MYINIYVYILNDESRGMYNTNSQIKFKAMPMYNLMEYSDICVYGNITKMIQMII